MVFFAARIVHLPRLRAALVALLVVVALAHVVTPGICESAEAAADRCAAACPASGADTEEGGEPGGRGCERELCTCCCLPLLPGVRTAHIADRVAQAPMASRDASLPLPPARERFQPPRLT